MKATNRINAQSFRKKSHLTRIIFYSLLAIILCGGSGFSVIIIKPGVAAEIADILRNIVGDRPVAHLETLVYQLQDAYLQFRYGSGGAEPDLPWQSDQLIAYTASETPSPLPSWTPTLPAVLPEILPSFTITPSPTPTMTQAPTEHPWSLQPLSPMGKLGGEGQWSAYLQNSSGEVVAYRTYLQPDPDRPYSLVAIVAFNLKAVQLNYVLGYEEPLSEVSFPRPGAIPEEIRNSPALLAVFNGGFKARHGHFGVMVDGVVILPPKESLGTVGFYKDGALRIGEWGDEISAVPELATWRQNGPLVVHHGVINPLVEDPQPEIWGYTIKETAAIWRSGIGVSGDGRTLYYYAGPSIALPVLARVMILSGASDAIQLDINNYWVHFDAIQATSKGPVPKPLFEIMGQENCRRYLYPYPKDFFFITAGAD